MKILSAHPSSEVKILKTVYPWLDSASVPCCVQGRFTKSNQIWVECVRVIISTPGSSATFPVFFLFLFSRVWIYIVRYGKKGNQTCNLQYDFARFIPLESKVPNASHQVVTGGNPPPPPPPPKKGTALPCFSNLSHHATDSLHVKFDSKVVACCRRTPRTLQPRPQCAIPSPREKRSGDKVGNFTEIVMQFSGTLWQRKTPLSCMWFPHLMRWLPLVRQYTRKQGPFNHGKCAWY